MFKKILAIYLVLSRFYMELVFPIIALFVFPGKLTIISVTLLGLWQFVSLWATKHYSIKVNASSNI